MQIDGFYGLHRDEKNVQKSIVVTQDTVFKDDSIVGIPTCFSSI